MITEEFGRMLGRQPIKEVSDVSGKFKMWDDGSIECEVGELLYGLVRVIKPCDVLETGIYHGWSSSYLAAGIKKNGFGYLDAIEWELQHVNQAIPLWEKLELNQFIKCHNISSMDFKTDKQYQLVLLDTEPQTRFLELERFWDNIAPGGIIVIHDLSWDLGLGAPQFWLNKELLDKRIKSHELQVINFMTPRGLTLMRKLRPEDEVANLLKP